uniref:SCAN domain-containing protein 1 n=1 Tax=Equus asinus asinus TaxID=83772 RepID=A0A8C4L8S2_EQUAS
MAATEPSLAAPGSPAPLPEKEEGAGLSSGPEPIPTPPVAAPAALGSAPPAEAAPRSPAGPGGSRPGPETFRQRFRQFRYQDAAGPREAFRQLRELSRQWLRPDIRTKEQIVEMLVQEQLLAILPEAARARRLRRRTDVRITG